MCSTCWTAPCLTTPKLGSGTGLEIHGPHIHTYLKKIVWLKIDAPVETDRQNGLGDGDGLRHLDDGNIIAVAPPNASVPWAQENAFDLEYDSNH